MGARDEHELIDALRRADGPAAPDPAFAARLFDDLTSAVEAGPIDVAGQPGGAEAEVAAFADVQGGRGDGTGPVARRTRWRRVAVVAAVVLAVGGGFVAVSLDGEGARDLETGARSAVMDELGEVCAADLPGVEEALGLLDEVVLISPIPERALAEAIGQLDAFSARAISAVADASDARVRDGIEDAQRALGDARDVLASGEPTSIITAHQQLGAARSVMRAALQLAVRMGATECATTTL